MTDRKSDPPRTINTSITPRFDNAELVQAEVTAAAHDGPENTLPDQRAPTFVPASKPMRKPMDSEIGVWPPWNETGGSARAPVSAPASSGSVPSPLGDEPPLPQTQSGQRPRLPFIEMPAPEPPKKKSIAGTLVAVGIVLVVIVTAAVVIVIVRRRKEPALVVRQPASSVVLGAASASAPPAPFPSYRKFKPRKQP